MKIKVFSIRDRAIDTFAQPFYAASVGHAVRSFTDAVNRQDKDSNLFLHPDDFDLYLLGEFNDEYGSFSFREEGPEMVAVGKNCKVAVKE
ncbi:MAG: nonstructural protein [Microvirus sp.]|nr:MAG: nonstructural protein [Microvirus sp.]